MASMRDIKRRKGSIQSTGQITKAMKLVSTVKLQKAKSNAEEAKPYFKYLYEAINTMLSKSGELSHPMLSGGSSKKKAFIVITSNRGLAGGYNANIFRTMRDFEGVDIIPIGKRACDKYKKATLYAEGFDYAEARSMALDICKSFTEEKYDKVGIVSTKYISVMSQEPCVRCILPLSEPETAKSLGVIFEPDERTILDAALPEYITGIIVSAVRESFCSEVAARKTAMDSAGKNAEEMIAELGIQYNRARQGAITQEITEIIAGSGT